MMSAGLEDTSGNACTAATGERNWDAVFTGEFPRVYNFLRYRLGNEAVAEDLAARTFEKAWRDRHRYRRDLAKFSTWLLTIARNLAIDHHRTEHLHAPLDAAVETAAEGTPEEEAELRSNFARLSVLLAELNDRERELLALKYGAGATNRAIADVTGLSESNVGTIVHRTVAALRSRW